MYQWGAIDSQCPTCGKMVPVYPWDKKGYCTSSICVECGASLQMENGVAVVSRYDGLESSEEDNVKAAAALQRGKAMMGIR